MEAPLPFGAWIEKRRKALDLTREELARKAGCSVSALRKIESDERRPSKQLAELLAHALFIPPEEHAHFIKIARGAVSEEHIKAAPPVLDLSVVQPSESYSAHLPAPSTPLVGREEELGALRRMLAQPECRLITLVGPGGIGKTRLALEAAYQLRNDYVHGAAYIPLSNITSPALVLPTLADALGFAFSGAKDPRSYLLNYLRGKEMLLVMDNMEHVLAGAGLFAEIMHDAPHAKVLFTSREPLNLQGEWILEVSGLKFPNPEAAAQLEEFSATALFIQTAQRVTGRMPTTSEDREAVVRICQLVAGIPLALELAASWARTLSYREIAQEIERSLDFLSSSARDAPARHRSMRVTFDYSWALLSEAEQRIFPRLSVFHGGFTRHAAEQVAGASMEALSSLVAKSLVQRGESGRFQLHELIRQYAHEHLHEMPEEHGRIRERHSEYYMGLLRQAQQPGQWVPSLMAEIDNLRAAWAVALRRAERFEPRERIQLRLSWADVLVMAGRWNEAENIYLSALTLSEQGSDRNLVARCQWAIGKLNRMRLQYDVAMRWLESARSTWKSLNESSSLCQALIEIGYICADQGDYAAARTHLERSLALAQETGDKRNIAWSVHTLGILAWHMGDIGTARARYQQSLPLFEEIDDRLGMSWSLNDLGTLVRMQRDFKTAWTLHERSLVLRREIGEKPGIAFVLSNLAETALGLNDYATAKLLYEELLGLAREIANPEMTARVLNWLGYIAHIQGNLVAASARYKESLAAYRAIDDHSGMGMALTRLGHLALDQNRFVEARVAYTEAIVFSQEAGNEPNMGCTLIGLAALAVQELSPHKAVLLSSAAVKSCNDRGFSGLEVEKRLYDHTLQVAREKLSLVGLQAACAKGEALPLEEVVELATRA